MDAKGSPQGVATTGSGGWELYSTNCWLVPGSLKFTPDVAPQRLGSEICERLDFECRNGTEVLVGTRIEPTFIIPELAIEVSVFSQRPHLQLMVEVTFPHTLSPTGDGPLTTLLRGPQAAQANEWVELKMGGPHWPLPEMLQEQLWLLRRQYQFPINSQNAYISRVVLNTYSAPGPHQLWLTAPRSSGTVPLDLNQLIDPRVRDLEVKVVNFSGDDERPPARSQRQGSVWEVDRMPFFPRIIQHQGEPFTFLKQLGFNTIQLPATATIEQLRQARELGLYLICPPPPSLGIKPVGEIYDPVIAWGVGEALTHQQVAAVERLVTEIRQHDSHRGRPVFAHLVGAWDSYGPWADVIGVGQTPFGNQYPINRYSDWLERVRAIVPGTLPLCADLQTELPASLIQQAGIMAGRLPPMPISREQLKYLAYEALAGGARALRFRSRSRLDSNDPQTRLRAQTLTWLNRHVTALEPWVVGGVVMEKSRVPETDLVVTALKTNRGQLLLVQRPTTEENLVAGATPLASVIFDDLYSAVADQAYLLNDGGLVPLTNERHAGGTRIQIDACPQTAAVVLTQNPQVLNRVMAAVSAAGVDSQIGLRAELTRQWLSFTQIVEAQLSQRGRSSPLASGAYNEALNAFQQADNLLRTNSAQAALPFLEIADQKLAEVRGDLIRIAREPFAALTSAPLLSHISLLPQHWDLTGFLADLDSVPNALPGGDFEDLNHMIANGWEYSISADPQVVAAVDLSGTAAGAGDYGLRLKVESQTKGTGLLPRGGLEVASGIVRARPGQLILIHGFVKIEQPLGHSETGLLIYDSVGGRELGLSVGLATEWQEFKLFRMVGEPAELRVLWEMSGSGTVYLDEVTVRTLDLPTAARTALSPSGTGGR